MKTKMRKSDHGSLIYGTFGTKERVLMRQGVRAIRVRAMEVPLYLFGVLFTILIWYRLQLTTFHLRPIKFHCIFFVYYLQV